MTLAAGSSGIADIISDAEFQKKTQGRSSVGSRWCGTLLRYDTHVGEETRLVTLVKDRHFSIGRTTVEGCR
jgi:hypothetical protein